jgi:hypothetical protein
MRSLGCRLSANTAPDLPPVPGMHPAIGRDHQYERLGACSILAALDLQDGHVTERVEDRHRTIRIILENHSAHLSKETQAFLSKHPNRFQYVLTPKHGSSLNIVETLSGKMARCFLRHIRVQSVDELKARILKAIEEINAARRAPVEEFRGASRRSMRLCFHEMKRYTKHNVLSNCA